MTIQLESHPGVTLLDPEWTVISTLDDPIAETFAPTIVLSDGERVRIAYTLPPQPYVLGTWTDADVLASVAKHLAEIGE